MYKNIDGVMVWMDGWYGWMDGQMICGYTAVMMGDEINSGAREGLSACLLTGQCRAC